jgi:hypothetical protein
VQRGVRALRRLGVVSDHQDRLLQLARQLLEQVQDLVRAAAVEVSRRLVAEQERRVGHDGAGDGDALLLPARQLPRLVRRAVGDPDDVERGLHPLLALRPGQRGEQQRQLHVAERRENGDEVVHLEDEPHVAGAPRGELGAAQAADLVTSHGDAARSRDVKAAHQVEERALPRAARTHEGDEIALPHAEVDPLQHVKLFAPAPVGLGDVPHDDEAVVPVRSEMNHGGRILYARPRIPYARGIL